MIWAKLHQYPHGKHEIELHLTTNGSDSRLVVAQLAKEIARNTHLLDHPGSFIQNRNIGRISGNFFIGCVRVRMTSRHALKPHLALRESIAFVLEALGRTTCLHFEPRPLVYLGQSWPKAVVVGEKQRRIVDARGLERSRRKFQTPEVYGVVITLRPTSTQVV